MEPTCSADVCKARVKLHKDVIELAVGGSVRDSTKSRLPNLKFE
jgi:hypothetical protein